MGLLFAVQEDVEKGCGILELLNKYAMEWMPPFTELSHVSQDVNHRPCLF